LTERVIVDPNSPTLNTQVKNNAGGGNIADSTHVAIGTVAYDTATLVGASNPTGDVHYYVEKGDATCSIAGSTDLGNKTISSGTIPSSDTYTFGTAGTYYFWAVYGGDANNNGATSGCLTERVIVDPNSPTLSTQVKNNANNNNIADQGHVAIGTVAYDTATLSGASNPTGNIQFYVEKRDNTCSIAGAASLGSKAIGTASDTFTFTSAGTYYFWAVYGGDANNNGATSGCLTERVIVDPNQSTIGTAQDLIPNDNATIGGVTAGAGGTVTFNLYDPTAPTCTGTPAYTQTVSVSGAGTYSTTNTTFHATADGTWRWLVTYSGDANNIGSTSACGVEQFSIDNDSTN
jgi:hypothetical protein